MMFAGASLGTIGLGSILQDPGAIVDPTSLQPVRMAINTVDATAIFDVDALTITDTLGQPVSAECRLINSPTATVPGDRVEIRFHSHTLFAGTIDRVEKSTQGPLLFPLRCTFVDVSHILLRRKLKRNFTKLPIQNILDSILKNELAGEPITMGLIDSRSIIPLLDADNARVFDVCREMAGATGQTFYMDFDGPIQMRSTSVQAAPLVLDESRVELAGAMVQTDRETYRNVQVVVATGTPTIQGQAALTVTIERTNPDQIAARQAVEGGMGRYEAIEEITHPTSNDGVDLALLAIGYAQLRLATSGVMRQTVRAVVRGYGFRSGQVATVNLPTFGIVGTYVIQRVSIRVWAGRSLVHTLELTSSSLQQRAYESWLSVVQKGKVIIQRPGGLTNNLQSFNTPGTFTWTVPADVTTAEFTAIGASGGGGGGLRVFVFISPTCFNNWVSDGGAGGNSGRAVTIQSVVPGQVWDVVVGAAGTAGVNGVVLAGCGSGPVTRTDGADGGNSQVKLAGVVSCQGDRGGGGHGISPGIDGATGAGIGDAVSPGGGRIGGAKGKNGVQPTQGVDGLVEVRW